MIAYWGLFSIPALAILFRRNLVPGQQRLAWILVALLMTLVIGLRFEVGGDWYTYVTHFETASLGLDWALDFGDPGYYLSGWLIAQIGGSIYWLNLLCALLLVAGSFRFAGRQPRPWLAVVAAVPYLLIVVGMGYTRQAAAIGLVMWGLVELGDRRTARFAVFVLLAALFHKTAILMLPIAALAASKRRIWTALWVAGAFAIGFRVLLEDDVSGLYANYIDSDYAFASEGSGIRLAMNAVPAVIFLVFAKRLAGRVEERKLFGWMSWITLACLPLLAVSPTAVDRIALYLIPLQLVVFSRLPDLAGKRQGKQLLTLSVVGYYALVQFVWLNFASHAFAWLPYQFAPLVGVL